MQDVAAGTVTNELKMEKVQCDMHQGDKVGASTFGELTKIKDKVKLHTHSICFYHAMLILKPH